MRKIFMTFAFVAIAMLTIPSVSNAITIQFKLNITDATCLPQPYSGKYCADIWIKDNMGNVKCQFQICNLDGGGIDNQIQYAGCDDFLQVDKDIYVIEVRVTRTPLASQCSGWAILQNLFPIQLTNNSQTLYVNI
jgi:hypothetical protein